MIHDYFRVTDAHGTVLVFADLFSGTFHVDNIQDSIQNGTKFYYPCQRFPQMYFGMSLQIENT